MHLNQYLLDWNLHNFRDFLCLFLLPHAFDRCCRFIEIIFVRFRVRDSFIPVGDHCLRENGAFISFELHHKTASGSTI
jgi:hypothetical protein